MRLNRFLACSLYALFVVGVLLLFAGRGFAQDATPAEASNATAIDLYAQLAETKSGENLFFSPSSISIALAMTAAGARGETLDEMIATLHLPEDLAPFHEAYGERLEEWNGGECDYRLSVANRLWGQSGFTLEPDFLAVTRDSYQAPMELLNFGGNPERSRRTINTWVDNKTEDKIQDLLPQGSITPLTRLVLTNAIYFKGTWVTQFSEDKTRDRPFYLLDGESEDVPLMTANDQFRYASKGGCQIVSLPYEGDDLEMILVVPNERDGLPELEENLSAEWLDSAVNSLRRRKVELYLPRFKMEASANLNDVLQALGIKKAFTPGQADFTGLSAAQGRDLYISDVVHKAMIDVNEEGTEAAAATGVVIGLRSMPIQRDPIVRADHPFLFLIRDKRDGTIFFLGRMMTP